MNVIAWLEFELTNYDVTVHYLSHYTTEDTTFDVNTTVFEYL